MVKRFSKVNSVLEITLRMSGQKFENESIESVETIKSTELIESIESKESKESLES